MRSGSENAAAALVIAIAPADGARDLLHASGAAQHLVGAMRTGAKEPAPLLGGSYSALSGHELRRVRAAAC